MHHRNYRSRCTGKSLSEALLFAEHGENMLCTKIVLYVRNNFCTQHVLPRVERGIFMYMLMIRASDNDLPVLWHEINFDPFVFF